ncbi:ATPase family AAA domain-containing protein 3B [Apiospora sp. TS-2023a]
MTSQGSRRPSKRKRKAPKYPARSSPRLPLNKRRRTPELSARIVSKLSFKRLRRAPKQTASNNDQVESPTDSDQFSVLAESVASSASGRNSCEAETTDDINRLSTPGEIEDEYGSDGEDCELHIYEARFDTRGERVVLRAGTKHDLSSPVKKKSYRASLVITRHYSRENPRKVRHTELEIQSKHIIIALRKVIGTYDGVDFTSKSVSILEPPRCLFHHRDELRQYAKASDNKELKKHMHLFLQYADKALSQEIKMFDSFLSGRLLGPEIEHSRLWMLFKPGCLVYQERQGIESVSRLRSIVEEKDRKTGQDLSWILNTERVGFVNEKIGLTHDLIRINRIANCQQIKGRIMIDPEEFVRNVAVYQPAFILGSKTYSSAQEANQNFSDEDVMTCSANISGMSLESRAWGFFRVSNITEVTYNDMAFEALVLQEQKKRLICSLVGDEPTYNGKGYDDMIQGKGRGLIFLLHGPPGVGKTYTAESIADHKRRPLLKITSGELSIGGAGVEERLSILFNLATRWNAIILLDEADAFMQERRIGGVQNNYLVSSEFTGLLPVTVSAADLDHGALLRVLEYYQGIMFLTTNRVDTLDHAFKSRIHLSVAYPQLSATAGRQLWKATISRAHNSQLPEWLTSEILDQFMESMINGREIRNAVSTGLALARNDKRELVAADIFDALSNLKQFESDLGRPYGRP